MIEAAIPPHEYSVLVILDLGKSGADLHEYAAPAFDDLFPLMEKFPLRRTQIISTNDLGDGEWIACKLGDGFFGHGVRAFHFFRAIH